MKGVNLFLLATGIVVIGVAIAVAFPYLREAVRALIQIIGVLLSSSSSMVK